MKKIILVLLLTVGVFGYGDRDKKELLGIMSKEQKVFTKGDVKIVRKLTRCAKNRGSLHPFVPVEGVTPITEIDILEAIGNKDILLVDMRKEIQYFGGTIPTAINVQYMTIEKNLDKLGCIEVGESWDCSEAKIVYGFCNGPVCSQSPNGIKKMVNSGYPVEKIHYYRGGMFNWEGLGFTTEMGGQN